jgi:hypothetical protein
MLVFAASIKARVMLLVDIVKNLTGNNECSRTIPPIEHNGNLVVDDIEKSELFNKFFCEQSTLDDSDHTPYFCIRD